VQPIGCFASDVTDATPGDASAAASGSADGSSAETFSDDVAYVTRM
jgi:hypothetical protein